MILKEPVYKMVMKEVNQLESDTVYGCDKCSKVLDKEFRPLEVVIFFHADDHDAETKHFCSWRCVFDFIPTIETDFFANLPYLRYDEAVKELGLKAFLEGIKQPIDPIDVADDLLKIHHHAPQCVEALGEEGIIYYEKDLLPLLLKWGIPPPDWDGNAKRYTKV